MNDSYDDTYDDTYDEEEVVAEYDTEEEEIERNPGQRGKWTSLTIAVLGTWLIISPWVFEVEFAEIRGLNSILTGVLLTLIGGYNYQRRSERHLASRMAAGFCGLLGLWLLVSPWVFELDVNAIAGWNYVVVGLLVAALGFYSSYEVGDQDVEAPTVE